MQCRIPKEVTDKSISNSNFVSYEDGDTFCYYGQTPNKYCNEIVPGQVQLLQLFQVVACHHDPGTLVVPRDDEHP